MIPNTRPLLDAHFDYVVAWDDNGCALVVSYRSGRLVPAVVPLRDDDFNIRAITHAPDWFAVYDIGGKEERTPLIGWGVREDGTVVPLETDSLGEVDNSTNVSNLLRIEHDSQVER
ncbi:hypothetical protein L5I01_29720 [Gordonia sp. HY442]|uniref:hypothetical protein n=1 Tax=Gordonia zhenghanii TaxID=2911516 RepID=UPI001F36EC22|nr:hypothetical protein [Gordonia zhenghanii]MCF8607543.1 hypothetical protein [Gordonia zhenghanii]